MQIFMNGYAEKDYAPDQIYASAVFTFRAATYDDALKHGVEKVKNYLRQISETTDFSYDDFKTKAYSVRERFHLNRLEPKTEADLGRNLQRRVSDGFVFEQTTYLVFDYDRERLAKLLVLSSKIPDAPRLNITFDLKDYESKVRELIAAAYDDARAKAETLAAAAHKDLRDCVRVDIDPAPGKVYNNARYMSADQGAVMGTPDEFDQELRNIDETFKPDDITVTKDISCVWETSN